MKIVYTSHLEFRIHIRNIPSHLPRKIFLESGEHYLDSLTKHYVAVHQVKHEGKFREMIIVYDKNNHNSSDKTLSKAEPHKFWEVEKGMNNKPLVNYDAKSDILYIVTKKGREEEFVEIAPDINVELDENGKVIGIEILNASKFLKPVVGPLCQHLQAA